MYSIGWFTTAKGQGSRNLLTAVQKSICNGDIQAKIDFIFLSREPGESAETDKFIELAHEYNIPVISYSYKRYRREQGLIAADNATFSEWRNAYDRHVMSLLAPFPKPDLCVLAGYMLIVGPEMCSHFTMINLHPAAPGGPAGTWQEVIWALIDARATSSGVMIHKVTPDLDQGPVVSFCHFPIRGEEFDYLWAEIDGLTSDDIKKKEGEQNRLFQTIRRHGAMRELPLLVITTRNFSEGRIKISDSLGKSGAGNLFDGRDLTIEIDQAIAGNSDANL